MRVKNIYLALFVLLLLIVHINGQSSSSSSSSSSSDSSTSSDTTTTTATTSYSNGDTCQSDEPGDACSDGQCSGDLECTFCEDTDLICRFEDGLCLDPDLECGSVGTGCCVEGNVCTGGPTVEPEVTTCIFDGQEFQSCICVDTSDAAMKADEINHEQDDLKTISASQGDQGGQELFIIIGIVCGIVAAIVIIGGCYYYYKQSTKMNKGHVIAQNDDEDDEEEVVETGIEGNEEKTEMMKTFSVECN